MDEQPENLAQAKHQLDVRHQHGGPFVHAVDATSMAMIVTDCRLPDNPIIYANASFLALLGYRLDEVIGKNYRFLYGNRTNPKMEEKVEEALNTTGDISLETLLYRKDGRGIWVIQHVSVQHENDQAARHFASFWDIDRRVRAEKEVRRAHALLEKRVEKRTRELSRSVEELHREIEKRRAAEDMLRHTLDDKEHLIRLQEFLVQEVNHRVKNTLQMASAFLMVQAGMTQEKAVADELRTAIGRLDRLADVHRLLYESADVALGIPLDVYLGDLCYQLVLASQGSSQRIRLDVDIEEGRWSADDAIPIALIVNEAVTNSLKHAFPDNRAGHIDVCLHHVGQNFYELVIVDDGIGGEAPQRPGSLGMRLIEAFARQLCGSLTIQHDAGTRITVRFLHAKDNLPPSAQ